MKSPRKDKKIDEDSVSFEITNSKQRLLKSAVVMGANASGKSNLVKSIDFFKSFILYSSKETEIKDTIHTEPFRLSTATEEQPSFFEAIFIKNSFQYRYGFEVNKNEVISEWLFHKELRSKTKEIELFFREKQDFGKPHARFSTSRELISRNMIRPNALLLSVAAQFNDQVAQEIIEWLSALSVISGNKDAAYMAFTVKMLENPEFEQRIINFTKFADLGIDDIKMIAADIRDVNPNVEESQELGETLKRVLTGKKLNLLMSFHRKYDADLKDAGLVNFYFSRNESEGTIKYFSLAGPIIETLDKGRILVIDELDSKLHPLLTESLLALFNSSETNPKNAQLIFTSHDSNLLDARLFRRDQIWFTQKDRYGATDLYSLVEYKIRNDASFEKDYLRGKYGATPVLKDFSRLFARQSKSDKTHGQRTS